jgi:hypothetical protein
MTTGLKNRLRRNVGLNFCIKKPFKGKGWKLLSTLPGEACRKCINQAMAHSCFLVLSELS